MATATLRFEDFEMDAVDAIWERVRPQGSLGVVGLCLCWDLLCMRRSLDQLSRAVSAAYVSSEDDRKVLRRVAQRQQSLGDALSRYRDEFAAIPRPLPLRGVALRLFDGLVVKAEDVAETAALGASADFANLVHEDLKDHGIAKVDG